MRLITGRQYDVQYNKIGSNIWHMIWQSCTTVRPRPQRVGRSVGRSAVGGQFDFDQTTVQWMPTPPSVGHWSQAVRERVALALVVGP